MSSLRLTRAAFAAIIALIALACTEPVATKNTVVPEPATEARLVLSDSSATPGAIVDVFAVVTMPDRDVAGSFTARIRYDSTALHFEEEIAIADGMLRATNATSGLVRFAGASQQGVAQGRLAAFRFRVLRADALRSLQLSVDELHTVERASAPVRIAPSAVAP